MKAKRFLATLIAVIMTLSLVPTAAFAEEIPPGSTIVEEVQEDVKEELEEEPDVLGDLLEDTVVEEEPDLVELEDEVTPAASWNETRKKEYSKTFANVAAVDRGGNPLGAQSVKVSRDNTKKFALTIDKIEVARTIVKDGVTYTLTDIRYKGESGASVYFSGTVLKYDKYTFIGDPTVGASDLKLIYKKPYEAPTLKPITPGDIPEDKVLTVVKTADWVNMNDGTAAVDIKVNGRQTTEKAQNAVIVLDVSHSMVEGTLEMSSDYGTYDCGNETYSKYDGDYYCNICGAKASEESQVEHKQNTDEITRFYLAKQAAKVYAEFVLGQNPENKVAIVTFAKYGKTKQNLTNSITEINTAIDGIAKTESSTYYKNGLSAASGLLSTENKGSNTVVFLTDGKNNGGSLTTEAKDLKGKATVYGIGLGMRESNDNLDTLSSSGKGTPADTFGKLYKAFQDSAIGTTSKKVTITDTIGDDFTVNGTVTPTPKTVEGKTYTWEFDLDGTEHTIFIPVKTTKTGTLYTNKQLGDNENDRVKAVVDDAVTYASVDPLVRGERVEDAKFFVLDPKRGVPTNGEDQGPENYVPNDDDNGGVVGLNQGTGYRGKITQSGLNAVKAEKDKEVTNPDNNGELQNISDKFYVAPTNLGRFNSGEYEICWYVLKSQTDGYHIDGYVKNYPIEVRYHSNFEPDQNIVTGAKSGNDVTILGYDAVADGQKKLPTASTGYTFKGWSTTISNSGEKNEFYAAGETEQFKTSIDLYAQWTYDVVFHNNYENADPEVFTTVKDNEAGDSLGEKMPADPSRKGFKFVGWYADADCTDGNVFTKDTEISGVTDVYAKWEKSLISIPVTYYLGSIADGIKLEITETLDDVAIGSAYGISDVVKAKGTQTTNTEKQFYEVNKENAQVYVNDSPITTGQTVAEGDVVQIVYPAKTGECRVWEYFTQKLPDGKYGRYLDDYKATLPHDSVLKVTDGEGLANLTVTEANEILEASLKNVQTEYPGARLEAVYIDQQKIVGGWEEPVGATLNKEKTQITKFDALTTLRIKGGCETRLTFSYELPVSVKVEYYAENVTGGETKVGETVDVAGFHYMGDAVAIGQGKVVDTTVLPELKGKGYSFNKAMVGSTAYEENSTYTLAGDTTVVKVYFQLNRHTVTFQTSEHGTINDATTDVLWSNVKEGTAWENAGTVPTPNPSVGYKFDGWYEGETKVTDFPSNITENHTYVAKFVVDENAKLDYKVEHYLDGETKAFDTTEGGKVLVANPVVTSVEDSAKLPVGYVRDTAKTDAFPFTVTAEKNVIKVVYKVDENQKLDYKVEHYLDGETKAFDTTTGGKVLVANPKVTSVEDSAKLPTGYVRDTAKTDAFPFTVTAENNVIKVVYEKDLSKWHTLTVIDVVDGTSTTRSTESLAETTPFSVTKNAEITGDYTITGKAQVSTQNMNIDVNTAFEQNMPKFDVTVTYTYTSNKHILTVQDQYPEKSPVDRPAMDAMAVGTDVTLEAKPEVGYKLKEVVYKPAKAFTDTKGIVTGKMPANDVTVTFVYEIDPDQTKSYTVEYYENGVLATEKGYVGGKVQLLATSFFADSVENKTPEVTADSIGWEKEKITLVRGETEEAIEGVATTEEKYTFADKQMQDKDILRVYYVSNHSVNASVATDPVDLVGAGVAQVKDTTVAHKGETTVTIKPSERFFIKSIAINGVAQTLPEDISVEYVLDVKDVQKNTQVDVVFGSKEITYKVGFYTMEGYMNGRGTAFDAKLNCYSVEGKVNPEDLKPTKPVTEGYEVAFIEGYPTEGKVEEEGIVINVVYKNADMPDPPYVPEDDASVTVIHKYPSQRAVGNTEIVTGSDFTANAKLKDDFVVASVTVQKKGIAEAIAARMAVPAGDPIEQGAVNSVAISDIHQGDRYEVVFTYKQVDQYKVEFTAAAGGSVSGDTYVNVKAGEKLPTFAKASAYNRYYFIGWRIIAGADTQYLNKTMSEREIRNVFADGVLADVTLQARFGYSGGGGGGGGGNKGTDIQDPDVPLAPLPELNKIDHFAYVMGYPEGDIRPNRQITREEVASIFYRLLDDNSREMFFTANENYSDVNPSNWSAKAVATLSNAGILSGYPDGTFGSTRPITRAEFAAVASRFDKLTPTTNDRFNDIATHWARGTINSSSMKGWINGYEDGSFRPNQNITRAEAMTLINKVLDRKVNAAGLHADTHQWPDNTTSQWFYYEVLEATNSHDYADRTALGQAETWTAITANKVWNEKAN